MRTHVAWRDLPQTGNGIHYEIAILRLMRFRRLGRGLGNRQAVSIEHSFPRLGATFHWNSGNLGDETRPMDAVWKPASPPQQQVQIIGGHALQLLPPLSKVFEPIPIL